MDLIQSHMLQKISTKSARSFLPHPVRSTRTTWDNTRRRHQHAARCMTNSFPITTYNTPPDTDCM